MVRALGRRFESYCSHPLLAKAENTKGEDMLRTDPKSRFTMIDEAELERFSQSHSVLQIEFVGNGDALLEYLDRECTCEEHISPCIDENE